MTLLLGGNLYGLNSLGDGILVTACLIVGKVSLRADVCFHLSLSAPICCIYCEIAGAVSVLFSFNALLTMCFCAWTLRMLSIDWVDFLWSVIDSDSFAPSVT